MSERTFIEVWSLSYNDLTFVQRYTHAMRGGVALQLRYVLDNGFFLAAASDAPEEARTYSAEQLGNSVSALDTYHFSNSTARRHQLAILRYLGFRRATTQDRQTLHTWLYTEFGGQTIALDQLIIHGYRWGLQHAVYIPSPHIMERLVRASRRQFWEHFLINIAQRLPDDTRTQLVSSLTNPQSPTGFQRLKEDTGAATLESALRVATKVGFLQNLALPYDVLSTVDRGWLLRLARQVEGETASEMRRHKKMPQLGLFALYLMSRQGQLIDGLLDLLLEVVHRMNTKSRRKVIQQIAADIGTVHGKERLLVDIALAALDAPNGRVADVIYPVAGAAKLKAVIDEHRAKGTLNQRIQTVMRGSYASHYRRMLPALLGVQWKNPQMYKL